MIIYQYLYHQTLDYISLFKNWKTVASSNIGRSVELLWQIWDRGKSQSYHNVWQVDMSYRKRFETIINQKWGQFQHNFGYLSYRNVSFVWQYLCYNKVSIWFVILQFCMLSQFNISTERMILSFGLSMNYCWSHVVLSNTFLILRWVVTREIHTVCFYICLIKGKCKTGCPKICFDWFQKHWELGTFLGHAEWQYLNLGLWARSWRRKTKGGIKF